MLTYALRKNSITVVLALVIGTCTLVSCAPNRPPISSAGAVSVHRVILFVWDGMRPDAINPKDTPNLAALARRGTFFADNHSSYPTITMINAAAFASGTFSGSSGFYGNRFYRPGPPGRSATGEPVDFARPVFTEDHAILEQLDKNQDDRLLMVGTLFQAAHKAGLITAAVGKSGPAFLQDYKKGGVFIDEKSVYPLEFAHELQAANIPLPKAATFGYLDDSLTLQPDNGDPVIAEPTLRMRDGVTSDPSVDGEAPHVAANRYLMRVFLDYILPRKHPDISVVWLRNPDSTEHEYGPGSLRFHRALKAQDELLGQLQAKLSALGLQQSTDLIVVSDHGHSNVSGPLDIFPLRQIRDGEVGDVDGVNGYSVSGDVRLADELTRAGLPAFDGGGCQFNPIASGIAADATRMQAEKIDVDGSICGKPGRYTTPAYRVPTSLPPLAFIIATNGGTDYLYQPAHDRGRVIQAIRYLQSHAQFGAIFVDARYADITGTLPLSMVRLENIEGRNPDIVVGYRFDEHAVVQGLPGIEYSGVAGASNRGTHGSFSPIDVHNLLIASGPDFAEHWVDALPSGNVDVAPTIAALFDLPMPQADGRVLSEALRGSGHEDATLFSVSPHSSAPSAAAENLQIRDVDNAPTRFTRYTFELSSKRLKRGDREWTYFDSATATRN